MHSQPFEHGSHNERIMDTSEYVYGRTLQKQFKSRQYPPVNNTYKDVFGEIVQRKVIDDQFTRKNLDFATFGRPSPVPRVAGSAYKPIAGDFLNQQALDGHRGEKQQRMPDQSHMKTGVVDRPTAPQDELDKLQFSVLQAVNQVRPPSEQRGDRSLPRLNVRDYQPQSVVNEQQASKPFGIRNSSVPDPRMRESIRKFYGDETPKSNSLKDGKLRSSFRINSPARVGGVQNNSAVFVSQVQGSKDRGYEMQRSSSALNNSYDQMHIEQKPYVSGFYMKGEAPRSSLLDHMRQKNYKVAEMSYAELAKRMVVPYKNDTRQRKIEFCEHSLTQPRTSMKQSYPCSLD